MYACGMTRHLVWQVHLRMYLSILNVVVFGRVNGEGVYTTSTRTSGMLGEKFLCKREDGKLGTGSILSLWLWQNLNFECKNGDYAARNRIYIRNIRKFAPFQYFPLYE